jgi:hypothetical protein
MVAMKWCVEEKERDNREEGWMDVPGREAVL